MLRFKYTQASFNIILLKTGILFGVGACPEQVQFNNLGCEIVNGFWSLATNIYSTVKQKRQCEKEKKKFISNSNGREKALNHVILI